MDSQELLKPNQPTVCFILGYAGSGKTYLAEQMNWDKHFDENFAGDHGQRQELVRRLRQGQSCTVSENTYVWEVERHRLLNWLKQQVPDVAVKWICFENNLETANENCRLRTNKGDPEGHVYINVNILNPVYEEQRPKDALVCPIYRLSDSANDGMELT